MVIDWTKFGSKFVKISDGEKKHLIATGWRQKEKAFGTGPSKSVIELDVLREDGVPCDPPKLLEVGAFAFVEKLRPLIEDAEASGSNVIDFTVIRVGNGLSTKYSVKNEK